MTADYDTLVQQLRAANVGREAAEREAARRYPDAARERKIAEQLADDKRENALEKDEQREIRKLFLAFGFDVYWLSQARKTGQTAGVPDLWCMHREQPIGFYWETKRTSGGRFSEAQIRFRDACLRCNVGYGSGDRRAAQQHVIRLGLAYVSAGGTLEPMRQRQKPEAQRV